MVQKQGSAGRRESSHACHSAHTCKGLSSQTPPAASKRPKSNFQLSTRIVARPFQARVKWENRSDLFSHYFHFQSFGFDLDSSRSRHKPSMPLPAFLQFSHIIEALAKPLDGGATQVSFALRLGHDQAKRLCDWRQRRNTGLSVWDLNRSGRLQAWHVWRSGRNRRQGSLSRRLVRRGA